MELSLVAQRIIAARKAKGLTQEELAALAGISSTHMSVIERGGKMPLLDTFVAIANALDISADVLLQDVVDRSREHVSTELSRTISTQSPQMQRKIHKVLQALVED